MLDVLLSKHLAPIWFGVMVMFLCNLIRFGDYLGTFNIIGASVSAALFMFGFMMFLVEMFAGLARAVAKNPSQSVKTEEVDAS